MITSRLIHSLEIALVLLVAALGAPSQAQSPAPAPTPSIKPLQARPNDVPESVGNSLYARARQQPANPAERLKLNAELLAAARQCLAEHPEVPRTAPLREVLVRRIMLPAAERMYADAPTEDNRSQLRQLATDVVQLPVYEGHMLVPEKVRAAEVLARLEIYPTRRAQPQSAATHIRALVNTFPADATYKDAAAFHGQALVCAAQLALQTREQALADEFCKGITEGHLDSQGALDVLAQAGHPALFECELTTLEGRKLSFPQDAKGKVVVVDFWATWCGPCKASMPHLKELHEKYKDRGVWIVGLSCDSPTGAESSAQNKKKVADFVSEKNYSWTHTYAGEWPKAAVKYGVSSIPKVFVVGPDGRILSASARGQEEKLIEKALASQGKI
jgi:thiol-disulfide isomerase/thioredoxin